ncbi:hypothetical protein BV22DRAFT_898548 [Leucogyrophana mollusca]|uniref:Uncharacterized protein n=1 Tax=Leucogyrophana mollusca TaxID=85980 RepID=A0ACB8AZP1_9AGAM|nr:hypothetical protein BV22DRAFT_898548 [Leucogyrophana mollusca]
MFARSGVLLIGDSQISSLVPCTVTAQAETLLDSHRIDAAISLVGQQPPAFADAAYLHQRIAFALFAHTRFLDAAPHFSHGHLDPRVLLSYFPHLWHPHADFDLDLDADLEAEVWAGVEAHMPPEADIYELIRNYAPHLRPADRPLDELARILADDAHEMLARVLRDVRARGEGGAIVDTVLAKLLARAPGDSNALASFLAAPNAVVLAELEPLLVSTRQYAALCTLYEQRGDLESLCEAWARLADGTWSDPTSSIPDPLERMFTLLSSPSPVTAALPPASATSPPNAPSSTAPSTSSIARDDLRRRWGVWMVDRDLDRGMQVCRRGVLCLSLSCTVLRVACCALRVASFLRCARATSLSAPPSFSPELIN